MTEDKKVHTGKVLPPAAKTLTAAQGLDALQQIVSGARECFLLHQEESSRRARIQAYERTEVSRIKAAEAVLKDYFAQAFAERRHGFEELFSRLDRAMDSDDGETVHTVLRGIVDIARTSPIADLGDLGQIRAALDDPDQVWEL